MTFLEIATERAGEAFDRMEWALRDLVEERWSRDPRPNATAPPVRDAAASSDAVEPGPALVVAGPPPQLRRHRQEGAVRPSRGAAAEPTSTWSAASRSLRLVVVALRLVLILLDEALAIAFFSLLGFLAAPAYAAMALLVVERGAALSPGATAPQAESLRRVIAALQLQSWSAAIVEIPFLFGPVASGLLAACVSILPVGAVVLRHARLGFPILASLGVASAIVLERLPSLLLGGGWSALPHAPTAALAVGGLLAAVSVRLQARRPARSLVPRYAPPRTPPIRPSGSTEC